MFYGFAAAWVILSVYVLTIVSRERRILQQLETLKRMLEDREKK